MIASLLMNMSVPALNLAISWDEIEFLFETIVQHTEINRSGLNHFIQDKIYIHVHLKECPRIHQFKPR